ncbi:MAG: iron-containing alcohol dehydrogenase [Acidimicrobiales bacterium]|jgi:alcohol dehydrogenase|nr:iron-containing alcohol dehydrogenase [Acidimicrobiales bacterium]HAA67211.1 NAD-dependent alcohol dehydrogenase [Acidimicrobiaceae bacterium]HCK74676.1 NAD-dependent alcohol dehydrogenase [Acidimicrobiaceae bacterium]|tara:strand:+ start:3373 stop:4560 length:1188 start_codon:yes stop_codon:yes gene_type:complete
MNTFTLDPMGTTAVGENSIGNLAQHVQAHGTRAFFISDAGVQGAGVLDTVTEALTAHNVEWAAFTDVDPNPTDTNVAAGVAALKSFGIEDTVMVLVGGGSVMDCGKYIAMAAPSGINDVSLAFSPDLDDADKIDFSTLSPAARATEPCVPTIAVPTTSGTASETNGGGLITRTEDHRKLTFAHPDVQPRAIILDPTLTVGLPAGATAACGMDVLTHSIEAYTSTSANPYSDGLALHAIRLTGKWLPTAVSDGGNIEARAAMQVASHLAGRAFSSGPLLGLVHATGHPISGTFGIAHGQTLATMLPHVMRFNLDVSNERYGDVGLALGVTSNALDAIEAVESLSATVGTDRTLTDLGATKNDIEHLTTDALRDLIILNTPRYPNRADVRGLYELAL